MSTKMGKLKKLCELKLRKFTIKTLIWGLLFLPRNFVKSQPPLLTLNLWLPMITFFNCPVAIIFYPAEFHRNSECFKFQAINVRMALKAGVNCHQKQLNHAPVPNHQPCMMKWSNVQSTQVSMKRPYAMQQQQNLALDHHLCIYIPITYDEIRQYHVNIGFYENYAIDKEAFSSSNSISLRASLVRSSTREAEKTLKSLKGNSPSFVTVT